MISRELYSATIGLEEMPKNIRNQLIRVTPRDNAIFHGGIAKALFGLFLIMERIIKKSVPLDVLLEGRTLPDIVMFYSGEKNINDLEARYMDLKDRFAGVGIELNPSDVDAAQGSIDNKKSVEQYLLKSDLTINEVLAIPDTSGYTIVYTDKCKRDTIRNVGILSGGGVGTYRIDCGRMIGSNAGITRLFKFLVEEKVEQIYLPHWWLELNALEAKRLGQETLGGFALVLLEKYRNDKKLQQKIMKMLVGLNVTDIVDYNRYLEEQKLLFEHRNNKKFVFESQRSFRQIQEAKAEKDRTRVQSRNDRDKARKECKHEMTEFECTSCKEKCRITRCTKCTQFRVYLNGNSRPIQKNDMLLCNENWQTSFFDWDRRSFYPGLK